MEVSDKMSVFKDKCAGLNEGMTGLNEGMTGLNEGMTGLNEGMTGLNEGMTGLGWENGSTRSKTMFADVNANAPRSISLARVAECGVFVP